MTNNNTLVSNAPGNDIPVVGIVVGLFSLVTVYYLLLIFAFKKSWKKLSVSYGIIIILLIIVVLISRYYFIFFNNYTEYFIADYPNRTSRNEPTNNNTDYMNHTAFTTNPFSNGFNIDNMCKTSTPNKLDHDDIAWKCRVRDIFKQDSFTLKTTEDDVKSSIKYPLKYDGIYTLDK